MSPRKALLSLPSRARCQFFPHASSTVGGAHLRRAARPGEITGFPQHRGKRRPCRDGGEIAIFACAQKSDRAFNVGPPTSSYAIMRRAYRGENSGPGNDDRGELDTETRNLRTVSVISGNDASRMECPLFFHRQTSINASCMSASSQEATSRCFIRSPRRPTRANSAAIKPN